ncbi:tetratricopeptide repeat protein [Porphyromonas somerae]|uniref:tetratricopeptide repeat protein n=1 Tax=Porphyromonas somerae TaxID=322095 RepID=UPI002A83349D|nr:tetratricopeptide repeat protein [Porphyromonas somerae]MDY3884419.1 tetratricopeptide repeat protein [Porphyromonas somerae]
MKKREIPLSEYGVEEYYPPRVRWHVSKTLEGLYGMVLQDMRSLPLAESGEIQQLEETYKYLTYYYKEGTDDPKRSEILRRIGTSLMQMLRANAAHIEEEERPNDTRCETVQRLKIYQLNAEKIVHLIDELSEEVSKREQSYFDKVDQLFDYLWATPRLPKSVSERLQYSLEVTQVPALVAQSVVSSLFVGSMEYFDEQKLSLLLAFCKGHHDPIVRGAAMSALLVLGRRHQAELSALHPDLVAEVEAFLLSREELLLELLKVVQISYKTTENHKTYEEKIVPELKNISDKFRQSMSGTGSLSSQIAELQKKAIDKEHFEEMEELMAKVPDQLKMLQDAEQDTAYHLVTGLKGFAFFSKMSHWFLRFDEQYPDLDQANVEVFTRILPFMSQGRRMISADMYSYALVPAWREVVRGMEADILEQSMPDATPLPAPTEVDGARELLFSAYRFYQLSSHRHTLVSPFARSPYLLDGAFLSRRGLLSEEGLLKLATMMVGFGQYDAAGRTYERVVADYLTNTAEVWRGMSVASIMRNDHEGALQQLQKAVELEGPTAITASKIAELLIKLGRRGEAIKWLETSEEQVESYRLPLLRAELLYQSGRNEEAMKAAYKAHYLSDGKNAKSLSIIVELLLLSGKAQEAKELLERATNGGEGVRLFWRALSTLAEGQRKEGIEQLSQWAKGRSPDLTLLAKLQLLSAYGYSTSDQSLIKDIIYSKE